MNQDRTPDTLDTAQRADKPDTTKPADMPQTPKKQQSSKTAGTQSQASTSAQPEASAAPVLNQAAAAAGEPGPVPLTASAETSGTPQRSQQRLGTAPVGKLLAEYALPSIIATSIGALYNFIDTIFIGSYVGSLAVAATTVAFPIMLLMNAVAMWIGAGGTANGAIKLGEGRFDQAERFLATSFSMLVIAGALVALFGSLALDPMLRFCGATDANIGYSRAFIQILLIGCITQFPGIGLNNFIRTDGQPLIALITMLSGGVLNFILNIVFVAHLGWGVEGSALATISGQLLTTIVVLSYFRSSRSMLKLKKCYMAPTKRFVTGILQFGLATFALQLANALISVLVNGQIVRYGAIDPLGVDGGLASIGAALKIVSLFIMPITGFAIAMQPILGFNYGAKKFKRVESCLLRGWISATAIIMCFWIFIQYDPSVAISLYNLSPEYSSFAKDALRHMMLFMPIIPIQILGSSYFQSTGQPLRSTFLSLTRQLIIFLPLLFIIPRFVQPHLTGISELGSIVLATPVADSISVIIVLSFLLREFKRLRALEAKGENPVVKVS